MLKCGITGGYGVLGKHLIKNLNYKFIKFTSRIEKKDILAKWIKKNNFDIIIHLAAVVETKKVENNFKYAKKVNFTGTKYLVKILNEQKKKPLWVFFASTSHVYKSNKKIKISENVVTKAFSKYGQTKILAEEYIIKNLKINYCIGRIFSFTEKTQNKRYLVPSLVENIKNNKKLFPNLNHYRDFIHINDICSAIEVLCKKKATGIFNIGSGKAILLKNLLLKIKIRINKNLKIKFKDNKKISYLVANIKKIKKIGWGPKKNIDDIIDNYLHQQLIFYPSFS